MEAGKNTTSLLFSLCIKQEVMIAPTSQNCVQLRRINAKLVLAESCTLKTLNYILSQIIIILVNSHSTNSDDLFCDCIYKSIVIVYTNVLNLC
jgi:hypothetical protein